MEQLSVASLATYVVRSLLLAAVSALGRNRRKSTSQMRRVELDIIESLQIFESGRCHFGRCRADLQRACANCDILEIGWKVRDGD